MKVLCCQRVLDSSDRLRLGGVGSRAWWVFIYIFFCIIPEAREGEMKSGRGKGGVKDFYGIQWKRWGESLMDLDLFTSILLLLFLSFLIIFHLSFLLLLLFLLLFRHHPFTLPLSSVAFN